MVGSGNDPLSYFLFTVRAAALASAAMAQAPGSGAQAPPVPFQTPPAGALQPQLARTLSEAEATAAACGGITVARAVCTDACNGSGGSRTGNVGSAVDECSSEHGAGACRSG